MSARDRATEPLDKYLTRLLLALVIKAGGEVRIPESEIDIDTTRVLVRDFDPKTSDIVLRAASRYCEFMKVEPEAAQWSKPMEERVVEMIAQGRIADDRHHIPTDEELATAERKAATRRSVRPPLPTTG